MMKNCFKWQIAVFAVYGVCCVARVMWRAKGPGPPLETQNMVPTVRGSQGMQKYQGAKVNKDAQKFLHSDKHLRYCDLSHTFDVIIQVPFYWYFA